MHQAEYSSRLKQIADTLYDEKLDFLELSKAIENYKNLLEAFSPVSLDSDSNRENVSLPSGIAIAPKWAAMCLEDVLRTKYFCKGIYEAVEALLQKSNERPIHIVYAGTGPFATLVLPLLSRFSSEEIQFSLIEVNPVSFQSMQVVFQKLEAEDYVSKFYNCDATEVVLSNPDDVSIVLVECLQHALVKEPQVAIVHNLLKQTKDDVILIPEQIDLAVALYTNESTLSENNIHEEKATFHLNEIIFSLNKKLFEQETPIDYTNYKFKSKGVSISEALIEKNPTLAITTVIKVYEENSLGFKDSGLTVPLILGFLNKENLVSHLTTQYIMGSSPHMAVSFQ